MLIRIIYTQNSAGDYVEADPTYDPNEVYYYYKDISVNAQYIEIKDINQISYSLSPGDTILLTGQNLKEQNGVYSYYEDGVHHRIKRAASYTTWAAYIGKIIYVSNGPLQGENWESLANGGTYSLWNPRSLTENGDSALLFVSETPILLFANKLSKTVNIYDNTRDRPTGQVSTIVTDNQNIHVGDVILYKDRQFGKVAQVSTTQGNR